MKYRAPSRRRRKEAIKTPNMVPILDAIFILIFFLLMSASFTALKEITSPIPILSDEEPPKSKKVPLSLTLKIYQNSIQVLTGVPGSVRKSFRRAEDGKFPLEALHDYLVTLKEKNLDEKLAIFEPLANLKYEEIVAIMDAVRMLKRTDKALYYKDSRLKMLFDNIMFSNIQS
jgi:biopolymer transport protein ExbD